MVKPIQENILRPLRSILTNPVSAIGGVFAIGGVILFGLFIIIYPLGTSNPYYGALGYMGLPVVIIAGFVIIYVGNRFFGPKDTVEGSEIVKSDNTEKRVIILFLFVLLFVLFIGYGGLQAGNFMDSKKFCTDTCHTVMRPEGISHANSIHSRINCVQCHVGTGLDGFISSKYRGAWRVVSMLLHVYETPIPTPVESLPPSEETCLNCHDTTHEPTPSMKLFYKYYEDEQSSPTISAVSLKVGTSKSGEAYGIHAHVSKDLQISYFYKDKKREKIIWIEVQRGDNKKVYIQEGEVAPEITETIRTQEGRLLYRVKDEGIVREMDCVDCHNRVGHSFQDSETIANSLLFKNIVDPTLPFAKRTIMNALRKAGKAPQGKVSERVEEEIYAMWKTEDNISGIIGAVTREAKKNLFPDMKIKWRTYKTLRHHNRDEGCFRCHNQRMLDEQGNNLTQDCDTCHIMVADDIPYQEWTEKVLSN